MRRFAVLAITLLLASVVVTSGQDTLLPLVINTWDWTTATDAGFVELVKSSNPLDAVVAGCETCEEEQCDGTVGFGGSPDESSETTLDAMIMDGNIMKSGAVGDLRRVKQAIRVARHVLDFTEHTLLAGDQATMFAVQNGFPEVSLTTPGSAWIWGMWVNNSCQPNYRQNTIPDSKTSCGPYLPNVAAAKSKGFSASSAASPSYSSRKSHDTISLIAIHPNGKLAVGTSTNGASHKIPGRVGDGPITGSGSYGDALVGGCGSTGDGDVMMRFLPCYQAVENMRRGMSPLDAAVDALRRIVKYYPNYEGALVAANITGHHAGACWGWNFTYSYRQGSMGESKVVNVTPFTLEETKSVKTM